MSKIILYSTGCPRCKVLEAKLAEKNVEYELCTDKNLMVSKGFRSVPILSVDNKDMLFVEAVKYVNDLK